MQNTQIFYCNECKNCELRQHPADFEMQDYCLIAKDFIPNKQVAPSVCIKNSDFMLLDKRQRCNSFICTESI